MCSPTNPFFIRGFSDHPVAFCKASFHNSNSQEAAAPAAPAAPTPASPAAPDAPATPESEPRLPETDSNQNSPTKHHDSKSTDSHDNNTPDNMWVKPSYIIE